MLTGPEQQIQADTHKLRLSAAQQFQDRQSQVTNDCTANTQLHTQLQTHTKTRQNNDTDRL